MRYWIENELLKAEISELGATLCRLIDKRSKTDVVLGYDTDEEYRNNAGNVGASIGRNANRIGNACFELNGEKYQLTVNDHMNQLHGGGINGFAFKMWKTEKATDTEIVLSYFSKDGEEGFPGNLKVLVTYRLEGDSLLFEFSGSSDRDTLFNMTNHSYFNLGDENILNEYLHITTDRYSPTDDCALTLDEVLDTADTPYDFSSFTKLEDNLSKLPSGIDNNYVWETMGDKLMAELKNDRLQLNVYSDLPDMHLYTAFHLGTQHGKYDIAYGRYKGICLECQYYPNGINYGRKYLLPILKKDETMTHYIRYQLKNLDGE